ncbi:Signal transduction histidine kinase [Fontimonas thermophila]|uniref:Signal transduction histidine-protein kinase/phosphatase MprB n=1 Tax=Fontimonas thermophila TaxID=1076937 RepID=A0A1I2JYA3_9GAMM|nr:ATP-binding protein [Fontimonas thermophila]SFF59815.1 Signal transduction histidine kinase [Fontimonas thermophila]
MSIRRILLLTLLLVSLLPATLLTALAFGRTRAAMLAEIESGVLRSAAAIAEDVERLILERVFDASTWNHLEVMQDLRLNDVDKRLSAFLAEMKRRHGGLYLGLHASAPDGRIVASSEPALLGTPLPPQQPWRSIRLAGSEIHIERPQNTDTGLRLRLRCAIDSAFADGRIGDLVLDVNGALLEDALDRVATADRQLLLLDTDGRVLAASHALRARGVGLGSALPGWSVGTAGSAVQTRDGAPLMPAEVIAGQHRVERIGDFAGLGWTVLLLQSRATALAPVRHMAWTFAGLLAAMAVAIVVAAGWLAAVISRPVVALTEYVRHYTQPGALPDAPPAGPGEIGELTRSFTQMVETLHRSQQSLVQASRLAALGEITALLAHEIRTPLGILRSAAQTLRAESGLSSETRELLGIIETETARLNRLVGSMLDSARTRPPQFAATDVHALIAHTHTLLAAQIRNRGISLTLRCAARRHVVECDAEQITQVLLNLVMNALQVLPRGGHVEVATRDEASRLVIDIGDDGPGIAPEDRELIFEPFVFRREGGMGLGLAVVRRILRQHGGDVVADRSPLGGALFRVWLPARESIA